MALTFNNVLPLERGAFTLVYAELVGDSAYTVGGETVNASDLGLTYLKGLTVMSSTSGWRAMYKRTNDQGGTLQVFSGGSSTTSAGTPVEAAVQDLSTITFYVLAVGH